MPVACWNRRLNERSGSPLNSIMAVTGDGS